MNDAKPHARPRTPSVIVERSPAARSGMPKKNLVAGDVIRVGNSELVFRRD